MRITLLAVLFFPLLALAQESSPVVQESSPVVVEGVSFEQMIAVVAAVLVPLLVTLARQLWAEAAANRLAIVKGAVSVAFSVTNEWAALTKTKTDDKVAYALGVFRDTLTAQGVSVKEADERLAKIGFRALHGAEKKAEELAAFVTSPQ